MPNRVLSNVLALSVGPCPATGFHFINSDARLNNSTTGSYLSKPNFNLLRNISRVQGVSFSIEPSINIYQQLGLNSPAGSEYLSPPTVNLNFSYLQIGVLNELRMGFYSNYARFDGGRGGRPYYDNNYAICLISGFLDRSDRLTDGDIRWPMLQRDKRNLFVTVSQNNSNDLNPQNDTYKEIDSNAPNLGVWGFGNCYITSYSAKGGVGTVPAVAVSYLCENVNYYSSGSGCEIPALNYTNRSGYNNVVFAVPQVNQEIDIPAALRPGDITMDFGAKPKVQNPNVFAGTGVVTNNYSKVSNLFADFTGISVQSYELAMQFDREPLNDIRYKLPIDRTIRFPVVANLSIEVLAGNFLTGKLFGLLNNNDDYDVGINIRNPLLYSETGIAIKYDFLRAKFAGSSFVNSIGANSTISLNFTTQISPDYYQKGVFFSGLLNNDVNNSVGTSLLLLENGDKLLLEDGASRIIINDSYFLY